MSKQDNAEKELYVREQKLLLAAKSLDQALIERDTALLDDALDSSVVLHADNIAVVADITGIDAVKKYYSEYWQHYDYKHSPVSSAADGNHKLAFTFAVDEDIKPKSGGSEKSSLSVSIWAYEFTDELKVSGIWFLRSLTSQEISEKFKREPGSVSFSAADYQKLREPQLAPDSTRTETLRKAAESYSNLWSNGKPEDLKAFVADEFRLVDPLLGNETTGRDKLEHAVKTVSLMWESTSHEHQIAVTPDSRKAFVLWKQRGFLKETQQKDRLYGLNLLVYDDHSKIRTVVGLRQVLVSDKNSLLK